MSNIVASNNREDPELPCWVWPWATVVGTATAGSLVLLIAFLTEPKKSQLETRVANNDRPYLFSLGQDRVIFKDDEKSPGLRAYIKSPQKGIEYELEVIRGNERPYEVEFFLGREIQGLKDTELYLHAVDREGNTSNSLKILPNTLN